MANKYYAYVIRSLKNRECYKGHCASLKERLNEHNQGKTKSNKANIPFEIVYFEEFETRAEAIQREKYFKSAAGRRFLKIKLAP